MDGTDDPGPQTPRCLFEMQGRVYAASRDISPSFKKTVYFVPADTIWCQ